MSLSTIESVVVATALLCSRYILGYAYSSDKDVVHYIAAMTPFLCISVVMDSLQAVLSGKLISFIRLLFPERISIFRVAKGILSLPLVVTGVSRGSGWQHVGAYINLGAFYLVGLPLGLVLGFVVHLRAKGFWLGIVSGTAVQSVLLTLIAVTTDWRKQVFCSINQYAVVRIPVNKLFC